MVVVSESGRCLISMVTGDLLLWFVAVVVSYCHCWQRWLIVVVGGMGSWCQWRLTAVDVVC